MTIMVPGPVRLAIVGTRVLACPGDAANAWKRIQAALEKLKPDVVISGGATGVDTIAADVAAHYGYQEGTGTLIIYRPAAKRFHGPGGYRERDAEIAAACTHLLRISCRQATTYGSGWTADHAMALGKVVVRAQICPDNE